MPNERGKIKRKLILLSFLIISLLFARAVYAASQSNKQKSKPNENKIVAQIQKNLEKPEPLPEFPKGEYELPKVVVNPLPTNWYKQFIYQHESGNNPWAVNPRSGACGLAQSLPCGKMNCALGDYDCQDRWATNYALNRYGSWENAYNFWRANRWW